MRTVLGMMLSKFYSLVLVGLLITSGLVFLYGSSPARAADSTKKPINPILVNGGWAYPGNYIVDFGGQVGHATVKAALDPTKPNYYSMAAVGIFIVFYSDFTEYEENARLSTLQVLPGVASAQLRWLFPPGQVPDNLPDSPSKIPLEGGQFDPIEVIGKKPFLGPTPEEFDILNSPLNTKRIQKEQERLVRKYTPPTPKVSTVDQLEVNKNTIPAPASPPLATTSDSTLLVLVLLSFLAFLSLAVSLVIFYCIFSTNKYSKV